MGRAVARLIKKHRRYKRVRKEQLGVVPGNVSSPPRGGHGPLALLCLTDFHASDMSWPLLTHNIFRIKESLLKREIREDWEKKKNDFF